MDKQEFQEYICRPYCMYFTEGEKEELACRGALIAARLVHTKGIDMKTLPPPAKDPAAWNRQRGTLGAAVCEPCPFRAHDCDFQSARPEDDTEPCGGYLFLVHLWEHHLFDRSELEQWNGDP